MTQVVLLSIKPQWAEAIFNGEKKWEYRKKPPGIPPPYDVLLYATSPTQKIVGEMTIDHEIRDNTQNVIYRTVHETPHSEDEIKEYFGDYREACAMRITNINKFDEKIELNRTPPRNFIYVQREEILEE